MSAALIALALLGGNFFFQLLNQQISGADIHIDFLNERPDESAVVPPLKQITLTGFQPALRLPEPDW